MPQPVCVAKKEPARAHTHTRTRNLRHTAISDCSVCARARDGESRDGETERALTRRGRSRGGAGAPGGPRRRTSAMRDHETKIYICIKYACPVVTCASVHDHKMN